MQILFRNRYLLFAYISHRVKFGAQIYREKTILKGIDTLPQTQFLCNNFSNASLKTLKDLKNEP